MIQAAGFNMINLLRPCELILLALSGLPYLKKRVASRRFTVATRSSFRLPFRRLLSEQHLF
jgi:hypothetical protein